MNQAILFPDSQRWIEERQVVEFDAQCMGALIICEVSKATLLSILALQEADENQLLAGFALNRFDFEEQAEALIEDEEFDQHGRIVLG